MFTGNLMNLCNKRKTLEVFEHKLSNCFIFAAFLSCIVMAICIFFELSSILLLISLGITVILLLANLITGYLRDKTKTRIIQIVEKHLSSAMHSLFDNTPEDSPIFNVYCWKYDKAEFVFHIEVYSNAFTHDQIVKKIRPIQNDINYVSDIQLNIYYCIWADC